MLALDKTRALISEKGLRRRINQAVSRALVEAEYANLLLGDPTVVLEDDICPAPEYLSLLSIQASDLVDFARQAQALFWLSESLTADSTATPRNPGQKEHRPLSAVAAA